MENQIMTTTETTTATADPVAAAIARAMSRAHPPVVMSLEDVANFCGMSLNYVRNELQHQPEFPPRLDRFKQPRYARDAVMRWAQV
jgi:hypothetical protein